MIYLCDLRPCRLSFRRSEYGDYGTSIIRAARCGSVEIAHILLSVGADVLAFKPGPLLLAAENGHAEMTRLLLATPGVDPNDIDEVNRTR